MLGRGVDRKELRYAEKDSAQTVSERDEHARLHR
jgi:hypothetical protein